MTFASSTATAVVDVPLAPGQKLKSDNGSILITQEKNDEIGIGIEPMDEASLDSAAAGGFVPPAVPWSTDGDVRRDEGGG